MASKQSQVSNDLILVIDMGGTSVKFGYSVDRQPSSFRKIFSTDLMREADPVLALGRMVREVVAESGLRPSTLVATVPGYVDTDGDRVLSAANIPGLNGRALRSELGRMLDIPVVLERDAVLMLAGEVTAGVAHKADHVLGIFFGTGIGAAYIHDGQPFRGSGWALEIGSMPFRGDDRPFPGMRSDCLEAYASGRALQYISAHHGVPIGELFKAADEVAGLARELSDFVRYQAYAVGAAIAMLSPSTVVLGGGVLEIAGYPRADLVEWIERSSPISETGRPLDLRWSELGWLSVLHGALAAVAQHSLTDSSQVL